MVNQYVSWGQYGLEAISQLHCLAWPIKWGMGGVRYNNATCKLSSLSVNQDKNECAAYAAWVKSHAKKV